jgi:ATP-binding cassette, subfamily C, bacterial CydD
VLAPELYLPLRNLAAQFHASADGLAVAQRLLDLVDVEVARPESAAVSAPSPRRASVRLEGVSFAYPTRTALVLDHVDLELRPGETVALVGPSGGGKSTIASLLLRLAEPARGRVTAGAIDLAECAAAPWRAQIAWVPQHPTLFRGSVADNIRLGLPAATDRAVRAAAARAGADVFIPDLPEGYDTVVGEGGRQLSAGELQRIAVARAFLRDAALVILDEPTAHLDPVSAKLVSDAVERLRAGRTVLLIVHRPELAARADRIVHLREGRIVETAAAAA